MRAGSAQRARVRALAARIAALTPRGTEDVSLVGFMAGALHALERATQLNYDDSRRKPVVAAFAAEFQKTLKSLARGTNRPHAWLAGFYLHSAMMRLDAVDVRLNKHPRAGPFKYTKVHGAVNSLKHDREAHLSGTRNITFSDALKDARTICERLEQALTR